MNRVTRISSAAFGMLLLAGLALYQGDGLSLTGDEGSLAGTALTEPPEKPDLNCEDITGLSEQEQEYCAGKALSEKPDPN